MSTIRPELVAGKLHVARTVGNAFSSQVGDRGIVETLWFLQWVSMQPGSIEGFVSRLLKDFPQQFLTRAMIAVEAKNGRYSMEQCIAVWKAFAEGMWDPAFRTIAREEADFNRSVTGVEPEFTFADCLLLFVDEHTTARSAIGNELQAVALRRAFNEFNLSWLKEHLASMARSRLPAFLRDLCTDGGRILTGRLYCPNLSQVLRDAMDLHAQRVRSTLAETVITKTVFRELDFAYSERVPVPIVGESRFGKTKSVSKWAEAYPGRARLVTVPDSNREADFMQAHAAAVGLHHTTGTSLPVLKEKVEFVIRESGVMWVYDEAQFLIPINYNKSTPPRRLNWVRCQVIDRDVPCAFFSTPQSYTETLQAYVEKTKYRVEQWLGRMAPAVVLSDVIPFDEIMAVARMHFPEIPDDLLGEIADRAILANGHLKNVELAGRRARFIARERGHAKPTVKDVQDAIEEMMPAQPRLVVANPEAEQTIAASLPDNSSKTAKPLKPDKLSRRGTKPTRTNRVAELAT
jgi:hypothetical protein